MKKSDCVSFLADPNSRRSCLCSIFPTASLLCLVFFIGSAFIAPDYKEKLSIWGLGGSLQNSAVSNCGIKCRPYGSEALPEGIVSKTSNLEMRPLWGSRKATYNVGFQQTNMNNTNNLFAMAVGIKQKDLVNKMVKKFLSSNFVVMLFHYDGIVDEWKDFEWSDHVIHISAVNQTKWYVSIIISEGLEISQPALDRNKSEVHHQITARGRRTKVHRRTYKPGGGRKGCDGGSTAPPCTGWIEMMAPVFSRAAWRCVWYMIQNDLIHAWGLDMQLGYCAQGDRTKNVGVVDAEYIVHYGRPTLGGNEENEASSHSHAKDHRVDVRKQSYIEYEVFRKRWKKAVEEDKCWTDPYPQPVEESIYF
ncbi:uncharacterized protein LOC112012569 isoform X4 [Quercus suber]|uniref:uncharacterized protein LOC112012569 isoform X4 n=1 Tax=Quercus suber TaxID=58331 RepID=UPI0032DFD366